MTTQGPFTNTPFAAPSNGQAAPYQQMPGQEMPHGAVPMTEPPAKRRRMGEGGAWACALLIPLVLVLGGYGLAYAFFGKEMPTKIEAGKYVLEMAGGKKVECAFDDATPDGAFRCASSDMEWTDAAGTAVNGISGDLSAGAAAVTESADTTSDNTVPLDTLTSGTIYEIDTPNGALTVDMKGEERVLISGAGRDVEFTTEAIEVTEKTGTESAEDAS